MAVSADELMRRYTDVVAANERLIMALEAVEWVKDRYYKADFCPWCQEFRLAGHAPDCRRQRALAEARGE